MMFFPYFFEGIAKNTIFAKRNLINKQLKPKNLMKHFSSRWAAVLLLAFIPITLQASGNAYDIFFLSECAADGKLDTMKKNFEAQQQRKASSAVAFKDKLKNITAGSFLDVAGNKLGSVTADGKVLNKLGELMGKVKVNGTNVEVYNKNNQRLGYISDTGIVLQGVGNEKVGQLNSTGRVETTQGTTLGNIIDNDFYDSKSNRQGSFSGNGVYVAAALHYFFFSF